MKKFKYEVGEKVVLRLPELDAGRNDLITGLYAPDRFDEIDGREEVISERLVSMDGYLRYRLRGRGRFVFDEHWLEKPLSDINADSERETVFF